MIKAETLRRITVFIRKIPGAIWLLEPIRRRYVNAGEKTICDFDGDLMLSLRLHEHMESQIFWYGCYSRDVLITLQKFLKPGMTTIDAGSNIGEISVFLAKHVGPTGKFWAFEPMPGLADRIRQHKSLNDLVQLEVCNAGLGHETSELSIYSSANYHGEFNSGMATLFPSVERNIRIGSAPIVRLDDFIQEQAIQRVDLMKIDIEGAELSMLRGAEETLRRSRPVIILEINEETSESAGYSGADLLRYLASFGYVFHRIGRKGKLFPVSAMTLRRFQNVLCLPSENKL